MIRGPRPNSDARGAWIRVEDQDEKNILGLSVSEPGT